MHRIVKRSAEKAAASGDRTVRGYASVFDVKDSQGDIVRKGAFSKAVEQVAAGEILPVLWNHDASVPPIGRVTKLTEDDRGLAFEAALSDTTLGRDVHTSVQDGTVGEVSIGGWVLKSGKAGDAVELTELQLEEISLTIWGANDQTEVRKISLYQASDALSVIASVRSGIEALARILGEGTGESYGPQATEALAASLNEEAADLAAWVKTQFKTLTGGR
jgi:HK97 family phage prohead protease